MNADDVGSFLSRWSRRKLEKAETPKPEASPDPAAEPSAAFASQDAAPSAEPLPPVESLTPESDFKPFMRSDVEPGVREAALKQLFKDPHFNVMDGLDTYIDDYSIPDPIPDDMMQKLYQAREHLFSPEQKAAADQADALAAADALAEVPEEYLLPPATPAPDRKA